MKKPNGKPEAPPTPLVIDDPKLMQDLKKAAHRLGCTVESLAAYGLADWLNLLSIQGNKLRGKESRI